MASKAVAQTVRLVVPAGKATASPPVGPALGARGVKSMDFCKEFNAKTAHLQPSLPTPVVITIQPDRTFSFTYSTPQTSYLIKKCADVETASGTPGQQGARPAGQLSLKHIFAIAQLKQRDDHMRHVDLQSLCRSIVGAAKSMGVEVVI